MPFNRPYPGNVLILCYYYFSNYFPALPNVCGFSFPLCGVGTVRPVSSESLFLIPSNLFHLSAPNLHRRSPVWWRRRNENALCPAVGSYCPTPLCPLSCETTFFPRTKKVVIHQFFGRGCYSKEGRGECVLTLQRYRWVGCFLFSGWEGFYSTPESSIPSRMMCEVLCRTDPQHGPFVEPCFNYVTINR